MIATDPSCYYLLLGSSTPVTCLAFAKFSSNKDGRFVISGSQDGSVLCWSLKTRRIVTELNKAHENSVLNVVPVPNNKSNEIEKILTQGRDGLVFIWKVSNNGLTWTKDSNILCQSLNFCRISLSWSGSHGILAVPTPSESPEISVYNINNTSCPTNVLRPETCKGKFGLLMDLVVSYNMEETQSFVFGAFENGFIVLWVLKTMQNETNSISCDQPVVIVYEKFHSETIMSLDFCSKTSLGYSASADGLVTSWSVKREKHGDEDEYKMILNTSKDVKSGVGNLKCRGDGRLVVLSTWDEGVVLMGGKKLKNLGSLDLHEEPVTCSCFDAETKEFALGSQDKMISIWSLYKDV